MPIAVVLFLSDEGQMSIGEIDPATINTDELQPVNTFEDGVAAAETLLLGEEPPPDVEEAAFQQGLASRAPEMEED